MSLAIASIHGATVHLVSDTQLTPPENLGKPPEFGLKMFLLDQHTAIAYAGEGSLVAHPRVNAIYRQGHRGDIEVLAKEIQRSFNDEVDFLLAQTIPYPAIAKISSGSISFTKNTGTYWIGNPEAAQYISKSEENTPDALASRLEIALLERRFLNVGGDLVSIQGNENGFRFVARMHLISPSYAPSDDQWKTVDFGNSQNGGYGYTTVVPKEPGVNGWGIFYFQGRYGRYFHVDLDSGVSEILKGYAATVEEFIQLLKADLGLEFECCGCLG